MSIAILNDVHFSARNRNEYIEKAQGRFFNTFFKDIVKKKIKTVVILGDLFDKRKVIDFKSLDFAKKRFFDVALLLKLEVFLLLGNHDVYYKSTNELNSPTLLLKHYKNLTIIDKPIANTKIAGIPVCLIPWVTEDNYDDCVAAIRDSISPYMFGHFELVGFEMISGVESKTGFDIKEFDKFDLVLSGHYHLKSCKKNTHQLGTQYEMDWGDYGIKKGYHIFSEDGLEFVENEDPLHIKYTYTGIIPTEKNEHTGRFIKIIVDSYENKAMFDDWVDSIRNENPADLKLVDNVSVDSVVDEFNASEGVSIHDLFSRAVGSLSEVSDDSRVQIKDLLDSLYVDALKEVIEC